MMLNKVFVKIKKGILRWFGHVERMNSKRLTKNYIWKIYWEKETVEDQERYEWTRIRNIWKKMHEEG